MSLIQVFLAAGLLVVGCKSTDRTSTSTNLKANEASEVAQSDLKISFEENNHYPPTDENYFANYRTRRNILLDDAKLQDMIRAALTSKAAKISLVDCERIGKNAFFRDIFWEREDKKTSIYDYEADKLIAGRYYNYVGDDLIIRGGEDLLGNNAGVFHMQTEPRLIVDPVDTLPNPPSRWLILDPQQDKPDEYKIIGFAFWYAGPYGGYKLNVINIEDIMTIWNHDTKKSEPRFFIEGVKNCYNKS